MPILRTIRQKWLLARGWVLVGACLVFLGTGLCQLGYAWADRMVYFPQSRFESWVSFEARPIWFFVGVAIWAVGSITFAFLLVLGMLGELAERRFAQRRKSRPPLEQAIREPFDPGHP